MLRTAARVGIRVPMPLVVQQDCERKHMYYSLRLRIKSGRIMLTTGIAAVAYAIVISSSGSNRSSCSNSIRSRRHSRPKKSSNKESSRSRSSTKQQQRRRRRRQQRQQQQQQQRHVRRQYRQRAFVALCSQSVTDGGR